MNAGLRVTGPANCSPDANTAVSTLPQSWTAIDSSSPKYTCAQLESWIRGLAAQADDEEIHENAAAWSQVFFYQQKLKSGASWMGLSPSFFRDTMQFPEVYEHMFRAAIVRDDVEGVIRTPVVNCTPEVRGLHDDKSSSSLDSSALRDILAQNAASNEKLQEAMFDSVRGILKSARRPVGTPAPLEGAKPTVTQLISDVT